MKANLDVAACIFVFLLRREPVVPFVRVGRADASRALQAARHATLAQRQRRDAGLSRRGPFDRQMGEQRVAQIAQALSTLARPSGDHGAPGRAGALARRRKSNGWREPPTAEPERDQRALAAPKSAAIS